jgi:hypothetical protein
MMAKPKTPKQLEISIKSLEKKIAKLKEQKKRAEAAIKKKAAAKKKVVKKPVKRVVKKKPAAKKKPVKRRR